MITKISHKLNSWRTSFAKREAHTGSDRQPFFDLCLEYLPTEVYATVIDIGAGNGSFADQLSLHDKYPNLCLLDGNNDTVGSLRRRFASAVLYTAPSKLPFQDETASFIHTSHLIEHLTHQELYDLLTEIDRVLKPDGVLVISAPLMWADFYDDLSHIKPYSPAIFLNYLCRSSTLNRTRSLIATTYRKELLQYRYTRESTDFMGSNIAFVDFWIQGARKLLRLLGVARYTRSGFTLILRKQPKFS